MILTVLRASSGRNTRAHPLEVYDAHLYIEPAIIFRVKLGQSVPQDKHTTGTVLFVCDVADERLAVQIMNDTSFTSSD